MQDIPVVIPSLSEECRVHIITLDKHLTPRPTISETMPYHRAMRLFDVLHRHGAGIVEVQVKSTNQHQTTLLKFINSKLLES